MFGFDSRTDPIWRGRRRAGRVTLLLLILLALVGGLATADGRATPPAWQTPYIIKNIANKTEDLSVYTTVANDDYLVFQVQGAPQPDVFTQELWRTDGMAGNTILLEDAVDRVYNELAFLGDQIIMSVRDDNEDNDIGEELWTSDGTPGGAKLLADLAPGRLSSRPADLTRSGPYIFFTAEAYDGDYALGSQLWRTDGTPEGSIRLTGKDLNLDVYVVAPQWPDTGGIGDYKGAAYSLAQSTDPASETIIYLLRSDGSVAGTTIVTELAGITGFPRNLDTSGPLMIFQGGIDQLWRSDGTSQGTTVLHQTQPGREILRFAVADTLIYYLIRDEQGTVSLWTSTGQPASNKLVATLPESSPHLFTMGNRLFFVASDPLHGLEPWTSDGTPAGTHLLKDIAPGTADGVRYFDSDMRVAGDTFYFAGVSGYFQDFNVPMSLWRSDGTTAGTVEVPLGLPKEGNPLPVPLEALGGELFFLASDNVHGREPWLTKNGGTSAAFIKDINRLDTLSSLPRVFNYTNDTLFFLADGGLWRSDGTDQGTQVLIENVFDELELAWEADQYGVAADWLYFLVKNQAKDRTELWRTDGTAGRTAPFGYWPGTSGPSRASLMTGVNDLLYFAHSAPDGSQQLWRSDGSAGGTYPLFGLEDPDGKAKTQITAIAGVGNRVFFVIDNWFIGTELLVTDGTAASTRLVKDIVPGEGKGSDPQELVAFGNVLTFTADDGKHGRELWRSDGTEAGTFMIKDIRPGTAGSDPTELTIFNNALYFSADDGMHGRELWRSRGDAAGTRMILDIPGGGGAPIELTPGLDWLYYSGWDATHGYQLWRSDGTSAGTKMVVALEHQEISWPRGLAAVDNTVFFNLQTNVGELAFQSDGTAEGTFAHEEAFPGFGGYEYRELTPTPGRLFFAAPYSYAGDEPAAQVLSLARFDPARLYVPEGGVWKRYELALNRRPTAPVTVTISSPDGLEIGPTTVTFTPDNWNTPQVINVRATASGPGAETRPATIQHQLQTADALLNGEMISLPVVVRVWRYNYLPTITR